MSFCGRCGAPLRGHRTEAAEPAPAAELRLLTVLSCALTGVAELDDPEHLRQAVEGLQAASKEIIERFDGHLADNRGDQLVVYFGYPRGHDDDARRALYAGLELVAATAGMPRVEGCRLAARVGVSTGSAVTGPFAGRRRLALGSVPHEAACLMKLAAPGGVLLGGDTRRLAGDAFAFEALGPETFDDLSHPLDVYRVLRPMAAGFFEPATAARLGPLIGRRQELALLLQRFEEAREGHGQVVLVAGEPGIGKTHLVRTFGDRLGSSGLARIECWCSAYGRNTPLGPFVHLFRRLAATAAGSEVPTLAGLEALSRCAGLPAAELVPLLAELLALPLAEPFLPLELAPGEKRERTLDALLALLLGLADEQPLALIAEDLHWADPSSLELFALLVAQARDARLLTVFTFRPQFEPPWGWRPQMTYLPLGRRSRRQAAELVAAVSEGAELSPAMRRAIVRRAGGVPLFVEEITKTTVHETAASRGEPADSAKPPDIPASLRQSLAARLDRLGRAKAVAQQAAVLGRSVSLELLAAVSTTGEAALASELDRLVAAGLLHRSGFGWRARYRFRHVLVQDMAYRSLLRDDRRRLHETVVRAFDERFPELVDRQPEVAARHATEAGLTARAIELWQRAGRQAFERSANAEAVAHLRKALELVATQPAGVERDRCELSLLTDLGPALITVRGYASPEVGEAYLRADHLCRRVGDPEQRLRVLAALLSFYFSRTEFGKALDLLDSSAGLEASDELRFLDATFRHGIYTFAGDFAATREQLKLTETLSRRCGVLHLVGPDLRTGALASDGVALWHLGYPEQALERHLEAMARARQTGHSISVLFALHMGIWLRQLRGEAEAVEHQARELSNRAAELELPYFEAEGEFFLAWVSARRAFEPQAGAALRRLRRGIERHEALGMRFGSSYRLSLLAGVSIRYGRFEEAGAALTQARAATERTGGDFRSAELHRLRGELLLAKGVGEAFGGVEEAFRSALETARGQRAKSLELRAAVSLGRLWQTLGRAGESRELLSPVYGWFAEGVGLPDLLAARELLDELS